MSEHRTDEERLYALLCATLLDEASPEERAEVERALATSSELRAERERLEATIGLVKTALPGAESLSDGATAELVAAALRSRMQAAPPRRWYATPAFRIAAALLVVAGGWAAYAALMGGEAENLVAKRELAPADRELAGLPEGQLEVVDQNQFGQPAAAPASGEAAAAVVPESTSLGFSKPDTDGDGVDEVRGQVQFDLDKRLVERPPEEAVETLYLGEKLSVIQPSSEADVAKVKDQVQQAVTGGAQRYDEQRARDIPEGAKKLEAKDGYIGVIQDYSTVPPPASPAVQEPEFWRLGSNPVGGVAPQGVPGPVPVVPGLPMPGNTLIDPRRGAVLRAEGENTSGFEVPLYKTPAGEVRGYHFGDDKETPEEIIDREMVPVLEKNEAQPVGGGGGGDLLEALRGLGYVNGGGNDLGFGHDDFYLGRGQFRVRGVPPTPEQIDLYLQRWKESCRRLPHEAPRDMFFRFWGDNPFETTATDRLSTFSVDVDTASYALARRYLRDGHLPEKAQVRTEEFLKYFKPDLAAPAEGTFAIHTELAPSLFSQRSDAWVLRVGIRGKEVARTERQPLALTFVVDVSGSMKEQNRLELVKHSLRLLITELDARDALSIVAFSTEARLVLPMTSAASRGLIESAIHPLSPDGGTNAEAGLKMGYEQALAALTRGAHNRVVLLSDGVANIGQTDQNRLNADVERHRKRGIYLNTVGVGMNNHNDEFLEQLANKGDGICNYVDDEREARRALVDNFTGAFEPIARDVKVQVEFDPAQVDSYRLLGYENRAVADQDFRNEAVDAGEVGAGHQVIALYEVVRSGAGDGPLATVRLRWKAPHAQGVATEGGEEATEIAQPVSASQSAGAFAATSMGYRRSVLVAQFAEFLRRSFHARNDSLDQLIDETRRLAKETKDADTDEFLALVELSKALLLERQKQYDGCQRYLDEYSHNCYWQAWIEARRMAGFEQQNAELEARNAELERKIRQLLHERYGHAEVGEAK